jgi:hypothetical protein
MSETPISDKVQMNPLRQVQRDIATILRESQCMKDHNVEIIEQDSQGLKFLLQKTVAQLRNVCVVVGVDGMTNDHPALEVETTISAVESVLVNRSKPDAATALDVIQAAIALVDGEWLHFDDMKHEAMEQGMLRATATFKGLVERHTVCLSDNTQGE